MNLNYQFPPKPSDFFKQVLADFEVTRNDPRYEINMGFWHNATITTKCIVCLAGAFMAQSLKVPIDKNVWPHMFDYHMSSMLLAVDYARTGCFEAAHRRVQIEYPKVPDMSEPPNSSNNTDPIQKAIENMQTFIKWLEDNGV